MATPITKEKKEINSRRKRKREGWSPPFLLFSLKGIAEIANDGWMATSILIQKDRESTGHLHSYDSPFREWGDGQLHSAFSSWGDGQMTISVVLIPSHA